MGAGPRVRSGPRRYSRAADLAANLRQIDEETGGVAFVGQNDSIRRLIASSGKQSTTSSDTTRPTIAGMGGCATSMFASPAIPTRR